MKTLIIYGTKTGTAKRGWVDKALEEKGFEIIDDIYHP